MNRNEMAIRKAPTGASLPSPGRKTCVLRFGLALLCTFVIASATPLCMFAQRNSGDSGTSRFVYLFGPTGAFVKLDTESGGMEAYWMLYRTQGSLAVLPPCRESRTVDVGCSLIWGRLQVTESGRLYGVFPTKNSETQPEDVIEYQVAIFQLPELNFVASIPIPQAQAEPPGMLLTPDGARLFVRFRDPKAEAQLPEPSIVSILEVYDTSSLKKLSSKRESASIKDITTLKAVLSTSFGPKAYFSADGNTIFDGLDVTAISGTSLRRTHINPLERLSPQERSQLRDFEKIDAASQRPWLNFASGDSAAGKTVVYVANASVTQAAYWTVDLRSGENSPIIVAPFGIANLTPDGRTLLLQGATVSKNSDGTTELQHGSSFWLYDVASGKQLGRFENTALAGPSLTSRLLCIAPSGKRAFFSKGKKIELISLPDGQNIREVETRSLEAPMASCVFAGE